MNAGGKPAFPTAGKDRAPKIIGSATRRRRFLRTAAGVVPLALLDSSLVAGNGSAPPEIRVLKIGEDATGTPLARLNSTLAFKVTSGETGGRLFLMEHTNLVKSGPPLHMHPEQDEWFRVEEGQVLFQLGDKRLQLGPGESVLGPRRIPHTFMPVGEKPVRLLIGFTPAGRMEDYFRDAQNVPLEKQDAAFHRKYEIELLGPPLKVG